jgi:MoaD family protein
MRSPPPEMAENGSSGQENRSCLKVKVRYFGSVRVITDICEEELEVPAGSAVCDLMQKLSGKYGEPFLNEILRENEMELRDDVVIAVNGVFAEHANAMRYEIKSNDVLTFFPIFLGGG